MNNKKGAIVAIEPKTGEILSLVSGPSYDPNLLVGRDLQKEAGQSPQTIITTPILEGMLVPFADFLECDFSCIFLCPIFHNFVAIWCPKVPKWEVLGNHFYDILGVG